MGILNFLKGENKGHACEPDENGVQKCRIFSTKGKEKLATGTEFSYFLDENCHPHLTGRADILNEDSQEVANIMNNASTACRKGIH